MPRVTGVLHVLAGLKHVDPSVAARSLWRPFEGVQLNFDFDVGHVFLQQPGSVHDRLGWGVRFSQCSQSLLDRDPHVQSYTWCLRMCAAGKGGCNFLGHQLRAEIEHESCWWHPWLQGAATTH